jgi:hypothetical protein
MELMVSLQLALPTWVPEKDNPFWVNFPTSHNKEKTKKD